MKTRIKTPLTVVAFAAIAVSSTFASEWLTDTTGDWGDGSSWVGGTKPGTTALARIAGTGRNNTIATLDTTESIGRFIFGQGGTGGSLTVVSGGSLTTSSTTDHRFGQSSAFTINLETGGAINVANATITSDAGGIFNINGGDFDAKAYNAGSSGTGTVNVDSASATIDIAATSTFGASSVMSFDFNAGSSVSTWNTAGLSITSGATLGIVGASALSEGTYDLLAYSGVLTGSFTTGTISGLGAGLSGSILSDGDSVYLNVIPEPGTYALLGGLLALAHVMLRRRR